MSIVPFVLVDTLEGRNPGDDVAIPDSQRHHLATVLRLSAGAEVELSDGLGRHAFASHQSGRFVLTGPVTTIPAPSPAIKVLQALPKGRKIDDVVRVLTEVGVDAVQLVAADHSVGRMPPDRRAAQLARLEAVATASAMQSRRVWVPTILAPVTVDALDPAGEPLVVAHPPDLVARRPRDDGDDPLAPHRSLLEVAAEHRDGAASVLSVAIGPEGGWSERELGIFADLGATMVTMGSSVMRTEHAGAAAAAVVSAGIGRW